MKQQTRRGFLKLFSKTCAVAGVLTVAPSTIFDAIAKPKPKPLPIIKRATKDIQQSIGARFGVHYHKHEIVGRSAGAGDGVVWMRCEGGCINEHAGGIMKARRNNPNERR